MFRIIHTYWLREALFLRFRTCAPPEAEYAATAPADSEDASRQWMEVAATGSEAGAPELACVCVKRIIRYQRREETAEWVKVNI